MSLTSLGLPFQGMEGVEHHLHYDVTVFAAPWLPEHYAGRMLTAIQVTLSSEEQLALQGFAGYLQKKVELVGGLVGIKRVWLGQIHNLQVNQK